MNSLNLPLKEIEQKAYRSTFNDGIYDLLFGALFLIFAIIPVLQAVGISRFIGYALIILPVIFPLIGKKYITIPRMGAVEFGSQRKQRNRIVLIIGALILALTLPLIIMIAKQGIPGGLGWRLLAMFIAPFLLLAVYTTDFPRFYIYMALLIFGVLESEILIPLVASPLNAVISFGLPGVVITGIGLHLLFKFIRTYPRSEAENVG